MLYLLRIFDIDSGNCHYELFLSENDAKHATMNQQWVKNIVAEDDECKWDTNYPDDFDWVIDRLYDVGDLDVSVTPIAPPSSVGGEQ